MCGRYNLITDAEALIDFFKIEQTLLDASELKPRYNIAPVRMCQWSVILAMVENFR